MRLLPLVVLSIAIGGVLYAGIIAWCAFGLERWRHHTLYAPHTWVRPDAPRVP